MLAHGVLVSDQKLCCPYFTVNRTRGLRLCLQTVLAHGVLLSDDELRLMAERGAAVAHCPLSNFFFADVLFRLVLPFSFPFPSFPLFLFYIFPRPRPWVKDDMFVQYMLDCVAYFTHVDLQHGRAVHDDMQGEQGGAHGGEGWPGDGCCGRVFPLHALGHAQCCRCIQGSPHAGKLI